MQPNSRCDQSAAPTGPSHSRSVAGDQPAANLALTRSPVATNASSGSAPKPRLRSSTRSPLRRCLAPVVAMRRRACGHRSPHSDWAGFPGERLRSESAGRNWRGKLTSASAAGDAGLANALPVAPVGETPVALTRECKRSLPRDQYARIKCVAVSNAAPAPPLAPVLAGRPANRSAAKDFAAGVRSAHSTPAGRTCARKKCSAVITLAPSLTPSASRGLRFLTRSR